MNQREVALKEANRVRAKHVEFRREINSYPYEEGIALLAEAIREPFDELMSIKLRNLLQSPRQKGEGWAEHQLKKTNLTGRVRLRDLTARERLVLAAAIHGAQIEVRDGAAYVDDSVEVGRSTFNAKSGDLRVAA